MWMSEHFVMVLKRAWLWFFAHTLIPCYYVSDSWNKKSWERKFFYVYLLQGLYLLLSTSQKKATKCPGLLHITVCVPLWITSIPSNQGTDWCGAPSWPHTFWGAVVHAVQGPHGKLLQGHHLIQLRADGLHLSRQGHRHPPQGQGEQLHVRYLRWQPTPGEKERKMRGKRAK